MNVITTLKQTLTIPAVQIPAVVRNSVLADIDVLARDIESFFEELKPIAEQRFVMIKNKQVWYDRENVALFPKFESGILYATKTRNPPAPTKGYSLNFEGFTFVPMTSNEFDKSFLIGSNNPYLNKDGNFNFFRQIYIKVMKF